MTRRHLCRMIVALVGAIAGYGVGTLSGAATTATSKPPVVSSLDVIDASTKVAVTSAGSVGYREVGTGSPILLIMGLRGSMDYWEPAFVAALAADHKVIMFDNAGVGRTAPLASPLSITEMADQTSAFISTLRLGRVAVLGWSMGGMIAQALAVLHSAQVSKLVLAATQPGTGHAVPIPVAAAAKAVGSVPGAPLSVLFPSTASAAEQAYVLGILRYPNFYKASSSTVTAQSEAVQQWMAGKDRAGVQFSSVRVPLLVTDGALDQLDPTADDHSLADSVPGAKLILYPGAGHGFLFQDMTSFVSAVERFVG